MTTTFAKSFILTIILFITPFLILANNDKLVITSPNGGEKFLVGSDTVLTWKGVLPSDTVTLELSIDNGQKWETLIDKATGLKYIWKNIPLPESEDCLIRINNQFANQYLNNCIEWQKCLGGSDADEAYAVQQTDDGGYVVAGKTHSYDGDVSGFNDFWDFWVVKLDIKGNIEWQNCLGGDMVEIAYAIQQTDDGGYIVAGHTSSLTSGDVSGQHGTNFDSWIVKLDGIGNLVWQKCLGGSEGESANDIQKTDDGGYIVAGSSSSTDGDVSGNKGESDFWIVKLDNIGNINWEKSLGGSNRESAKSIQQTTDGGYIVAGSSSSTDGDVSENKGEYDYWVVKLDNIGNIEWQKCLGGTEDDFAKSIHQTTDGGYIIAGETNSNNGDVSGNHGGLDFWIVKLDEIGNLVWQKCLGGTDKDRANSIQQAEDGGYIVAGSTSSYDGDVSGKHNYTDFWVVKLDESGNNDWQKCLGGKSTDIAYSIQQTEDGGYIIAGQSYSNDGDVSGNHGHDFWVVKLFPENNNPIQADTSDALFSIVAPQAEAMPVDLGEVLVDDTRDSMFVDFIKSKGSYPCRIDSITIKTGDEKNFLAFSDLPTKVDESYSSHPVEFRFMPDKVGPFNSLIHVYTQAELLTYAITGVGVERTLAVYSEIIDFGLVEITDFRDTTKVLITNISDEDIEITNIEIIGPDTEQFEIISGGGAFTLAADSERELKIRFAPKYAGKTSSRIAFEYTGTGSPAMVQLIGEGILSGTPDDIVAILKVDSILNGFQPGDIVEIPIRLFAQQNLESANVTGFRTELHYNSTMLVPLQGNVLSGSNSSWIELDLDLDNLDGDKFGSPPKFHVTLGNDTATTLVLKNSVSLGDSIKVESIPGYFKMTGVCMEGGFPRLIGTSGTIGITKISPNPTKYHFTFDYEIIEDALTEIYIVDISGKKIKTLVKGELKHGKYTKAINTEGLGSGLHFIILETPTAKKAVKIQIEK
jgi:hypothetical protein